MKKIIVTYLSFLALATVSMTIPSKVQADETRQLQVAGRTLTFIENGPTGKVVMAVVFDSSKPASVSEKDEVMSALGAGLNLGTVTIIGKAVDVGALSNASDAGVLYLTHGVNFAVAGAFAKGKKLLTMSSDLTCVNSGSCVMGVVVAPKVDIYVNTSSANAIGAHFKAAFKMMIKEI